MNQKNLEAKKSAVAALAEKIKDSTSTIIVEYRGLTVAKMSALRRSLKGAGASLSVHKNTLFRKACAAAGVKGLDEYLTGSNAYVFAPDVVGAPKILAKFARKNRQLVLKAGYVERTLVDGARLAEIARMPDREGQLSMLLSCLQAPVRKFACAVKAISDKISGKTEETQAI